MDLVVHLKYFQLHVYLVVQSGGEMEGKQLCIYAVHPKFKIYPPTHSEN